MAKRYYIQVRSDEQTRERLRTLAGEKGMSEYLRRLVDVAWDLRDDEEFIKWLEETDGTDTTGSA